MYNDGDYGNAENESEPVTQPTSRMLRWVDPATVIPGSIVIVNVMWSPHPKYNLGNSYPKPPVPPHDTQLGSWTVASWMLPSFHDDHPVRWSCQVEGIALLFQEVDDHLVVDTGSRTWAIPHGLANIVAVRDGTPTLDQDAVRAPCGAVSDDGRPCSVPLPHPSHRTAYPFVWWPNDEWREPTARTEHTVTDLARSIPPEPEAKDEDH